jgi:hypothetical protein
MLNDGAQEVALQLGSSVTAVREWPAGGTRHCIPLSCSYSYSYSYSKYDLVGWVELFSFKV